MLLRREIRTQMKDATFCVKNMSWKWENMKTHEYMKLLLHREFTKKLTCSAPLFINSPTEEISWV